MRPKRLTKNDLRKEQKKLERKLEKLQRLVVIERDGGCVLRGVVQHHCHEVLQADHLVSRNKRSIFFDIRNLNCVCKTVNGTKSRHWKGTGWEKIQRELERLTNERYGDGTVEDLEFKGRTERYDMTPEQLQAIISEYEEGLRLSTYAV